MTIQKPVADLEARLRLLDPRYSFLVQAPAGSGKTGLLIQRFLLLLTQVKSPEEIIAITFTRKAANEMRQRILQALEQAQSEQPPEDPYILQIWTLARQVLECDRTQGWQLLNHSNRLRIQTIDSLCAMLVGQMPVLSQLGALPSIADDATNLYQEAARRTLEEVESHHQTSDAIAHLIAHLDNQLQRLQHLIAALLQRRDQWLPNLIDLSNEPRVRQQLEMALAWLVEEALEKLAEQAQSIDQAELVALANFAATQVITESSIAACQSLQALPDSNLADRKPWEGIAELLLTKEGKWRKGITKREGFPSPSQFKDKQEQGQYQAMKQRMVTLLENLESAEDFRMQLASIRSLPASSYAET